MEATNGRVVTALVALLLTTPAVAQERCRAIDSNTLPGLVVAVADGDTLTVLDQCKQQHRIRLSDIDAPERRQAFGTRSRQSLAELCHNKTATISDQGKDRYGRTLGTVRCAGVDVNAEQVRRGQAWVYERYAPKDSPLYSIQAEAKAGKRGLWRDPNPVPPWQWRKYDR